jgi:hypothetical protein
VDLSDALLDVVDGEISGDPGQVKADVMKCRGKLDLLAAVISKEESK